MKKLWSWLRQWACGPEPSVPAKLPNDTVSDAINMIIYHKLQATLGDRVSDLTVWLSGDYSSAMRTRVEDQWQKIVRLREWAKDLDDRVARKHYLEWLDYYYIPGIRDARRELETQATRRSQQAFRRENDQRHEAQIEVEKTRTIPEPPKDLGHGGAPCPHGYELEKEATRDLFLRCRYQQGHPGTHRPEGADIEWNTGDARDIWLAPKEAR